MNHKEDPKVEELKKQQAYSISMMSGNKKVAREFVAEFLEGTNEELQKLLDSGLGGVAVQMQIMRNIICIEALRE